MLKIMTNLRDYKFLGRLLSEILCDLHIHFSCGACIRMWVPSTHPMMHGKPPR